MAVTPDDGDAAAFPAPPHRSMPDDLDAVAQPACPTCGTVMHDTADGYACRSCGSTVTDDREQAARPTDLDGPAIHWG